MDGGDRLAVVAPAVELGHAHAAEPDCRDCESLLSVVSTEASSVHAAHGVRLRDSALEPAQLIKERLVAEFAKAGADSITVQLEATPNVHYVLMQIRDQGCLAGLAINPGTPPEAVSSVVDVVDLVLCMTVNPGWGGQAFIERSPEKVRQLR